MDKIIIIGGGIAGLTAAETIRKNSKEVTISIITDEDYYPYSRIKLSKYINLDINLDDLYIHKQNWYEDMNINIMNSSKVEKIDSLSKEVRMDNGDVLNYNKLIIASGGYNFIPPFPNVNIKVLFVLFIAGLVVGLVIFIKNNIFTKEEISQIKSTFKSKKTEAKKEVCTICGKELDAEWKSCPHCGKEKEVQVVQ
jgi:nitrite reductase (NADH) large subunit